MGKFLEHLSELSMRRSKKPWARFISKGIDKDGQVEFKMAWNKAFLKNIKAAGFEADSPEEAVELFLFGTLMMPKGLIEEDEVVSDYHPNLQSELNQLRK